VLEDRDEMTLSRRAHASIDDIMPRIRGVVADRSATQNANIDLSTAENWLLRPQLVEMCKDAISQHLTTKVERPTVLSRNLALIQHSGLFIPSRIRRR
jgi:hypothetical protein